MSTHQGGEAVRISSRIGIPILAVLLLALLLLTACSSDDDEEPQPAGIQPSGPSTIETSDEQKPVVITIGNHSDITGAASNAISVIDMALEDMASYYNDYEIIPGVKFEVVSYDGQYDPARAIPGYEWLRQRGADVLFTPVASTAETLKPRLDDDKIVLFALGASDDAIDPPGYVFSPGNSLCKYTMYTFLEWIAENDPDFPRDRPAKIGGTFWAIAYGEAMLDGMEEYAEVHPDQYEWIGGYLPPLGMFNWAPEVQALKDCDYVLPPGVMLSFVQQYRKAGHEARFIATDAQVSFLGMVGEAGLWDEIDGMLLFKPARWWNEQGEAIDLANRLVREYHPDDAEKIIGKGSGYLASQQVYVIFKLIEATIEAVGAENFDSHALYKTAQSFSLTIDGIQSDSFSETKRYSSDYAGFYEVDGEKKDVFRVTPEWFPIVSKP